MVVVEGVEWVLVVDGVLLLLLLLLMRCLLIMRLRLLLLLRLRLVCVVWEVYSEESALGEGGDGRARTKDMLHHLEELHISGTVEHRLPRGQLHQ